MTTHRRSTVAVWLSLRVTMAASLLSAALAAASLASTSLPPGAAVRDRFHAWWSPPKARSRPTSLPALAARPSSAASTCGSWFTVMPDSAPVALADHAMIYDPVRDRLLVFGGTTPLGPYSAQVWALPLAGAPAWSVVATTGSGPLGRISSSVIYDSSRDRVVLFGGYDSGAESDVWVLDLATSTWSFLPTDGDAPPPRFLHSAIYDASRDRMVVFGGQDNSQSFDDTWALSFVGSPTWTQLSPAGTPPTARAGQTAIYDAPRDRMVVFGGATPGLVDDVWSLSFAGGGTWTALSPSGTAPSSREFTASLFDSPRNRMILFGGYADDGSGNQIDVNDLWSLAFTPSLKWTKLNPSGDLPPAVNSHAIVYDSSRQQLVDFGGWGGLDQIWTSPLSTSAAWTEIVPADQGPLPRGDAAVIEDAVRHRVLLYGGQPNGSAMDDAWVLPQTGTPAWTRLLPTGTRPARYGHAAALDSSRSRMIVFGGSDGFELVNDVWALALIGTPAWSKLTPSGTKPPPRYGGRAIYDPGRDRIVVYGGFDTTNTVLGDAWALSLSGSGAWTHLTPSGGPPRFAEAAVIYDRPRDRMIVLAGNNPFGDAPAWQLSFAGSGTWSPISTPHAPPAAPGPAGVFDGARNRMLLLSNGSAPRALTLAGTADWIDAGIAGYVETHDLATAVIDLDNDRAVTFGGATTNTTHFFNDVRSLSFQGALLEVIASPALSNAVDVSPAGPCYDLGSHVTVTATPPAGYLFTGWSGDASGAVNPLDLTMSADRVVVANFAQGPPTCDGWRFRSPIRCRSTCRRRRSTRCAIG